MATQNPFNNFLNSKGFQNGLDIASTIADVFPNLSNFNSNIGDRNVNSTDALTSNIRSGLISTASKFGPIGAAIGAGLTIIDKTGGFSDASEGLGWGLDTANALSSILLPGAGYIAPKTDTLELDNKLASSGSYTGTINSINETSKNANSRLLFGSNFANNQINKAKSNQEKGLDILKKGEIAKIINPTLAMQNQINLAGGFNPMYSKKGAKIENLDRAKKILNNKPKRWKEKPSFKEWEETVNPEYLNSNYDLEKAYNNYPFEMLEAWRKDPKNNHLDSLLEIPNDDGTFDYEFLKLGTSDENPEIKYELNGYYSDPNWNVNPNTHKLEFKNGRYYYRAIPPAVRNESTIVDYFKEGGSINVIPDGALHARKHHLENIDEKYKEVTNKGIPVISETESGEITQHAEVEKEEIIFRLEVTKKLEELAKENTDESAIEAGKLLVQEILYNTEDNTNKLL